MESEKVDFQNLKRRPAGSATPKCYQGSEGFQCLLWMGAAENLVLKLYVGAGIVDFQVLKRRSSGQVAPNWYHC